MKTKREDYIEREERMSFNDAFTDEGVQMGTEVIKAVNICKSFGEKEVLKNYSAEFNSGITCLMGNSGVGKTTLLHILAGIIKADGGTVEGVNDKRIGMVFQENRLINNLCALKNLSLVCDDKIKNEEILTELGLDDSLHCPVSTLSGGMKRRVALARALVFKADIYLFDEPFKGLDDKLKISVMQTVKNRIKDAVSIIVTHDKDEADFLDAKIVEMESI